MSDQTKNPAVVGEDGELIQADMSVDPDAHSEFVATHVHRDPLLFRAREHVKEWGCAYLFVVPIVLIFIVVTIEFLVKVLSGDADGLDWIALLELIGFVAFVYWKLRSDTRP